MADLPCVAVRPISLAYSGSICCTAPLPRVARCQVRMKAAKISTETSPARSVREGLMGRAPSLPPSGRLRPSSTGYGGRVVRPQAEPCGGSSEPPHPARLLASLAATLPFQGRDRRRELSEFRECPAALRQVDRLIAKLFTYSSGLAGSKVLPITTKLLVVAAGGVRPTSFISFVVSVARNTWRATAA